MSNYELPNTTDYFSLYALSEEDIGKSLILYNKGTTSGYIKQGDDEPENINTEYPVKPGHCVMIQGHKDQDIYIRGVQGQIVIQPLVNTVAPFTFVDLPHYLYTSELERYRRLRVDVAQTSFFTGQEGRTFYEMNIANGTSIYIKALVAIDTILHDLTITVDDGSLRVTTLAGATETTPFNTPLPIILKNTMAGRPSPYYALQNVISTGGTITGGTALDIVRVVSSASTAQRSSVGGTLTSERGIAAGTYYFKLENIGTGSVTGVFSSWWEERPMPNF